MEKVEELYGHGYLGSHLINEKWRNFHKYLVRADSRLFENNDHRQKTISERKSYEKNNRRMVMPGGALIT